MTRRRLNPSRNCTASKKPYDSNQKEKQILIWASDKKSQTSRSLGISFKFVVYRTILIRLANVDNALSEVNIKEHLTFPTS